MAIKTEYWSNEVKSQSHVFLNLHNLWDSVVDLFILGDRGCAPYNK